MARKNFTPADRATFAQADLPVEWLNATTWLPGTIRTGVIETDTTGWQYIEVVYTGAARRREIIWAAPGKVRLPRP